MMYIINASPRLNGNTAQLLEACKKGMEAGGQTVVLTCTS